MFYKAVEDVLPQLLMVILECLKEAANDNNVLKKLLMIIMFYKSC